MKVWIFMGALVCALSALWAAPDFTHPHTHLGASTSRGQMIRWVDIPGLHLKGGTFLPLRFRLSSEPAGGVPLFGKFWWFPIMESTLVRRSETFYQFTTLGGRVIPLRIGKEGDFTSGDGRYKGSIVSPSESMVESDGWQYRFVNGRLRSARLPDGTVWQWAYDSSSRLRAITENGRSDLIAFVYKGQEKFPSALKIGKTQFNFEYQQVPITKGVMGQALVAGYETSLAKISSTEKEEAFPIQLDRDGKYVMEYRSKPGQGNRYTWSAQDGLLQSEGEWTYKLTAREANLPPLVSRTNQAGQIESYVYDVNTGISEHRRPDGTVVTRQYFIGRGPAFHKIRLLTSIKNGKELENLRWSYDEAGRLIRETSGTFQKEYAWYPNGALRETSESRDGRLLAREVLDEKGRPLEKFKNGTTTKLSYEGTRVLALISDGKNTPVAKVYDSATREVSFFKVPNPSGVQAQTVLSAAGSKLAVPDRGAAEAMVQKFLNSTNEKNPAQ